MKLTKNFTLKELTKSNTATKLGINNSISPNYSSYEEALRKATHANMPEKNKNEIMFNFLIFENLENLTKNVLQPLRDKLGLPIHINSGYRSKELNKAIGGAKNSQHCKGQAVDIVCKELDTKKLFEFILNSNLEYDQLILEFYDEQNPLSSWVHVSYNINGNRKQVLRAVKINGKTEYLEEKDK